MSRRLVASVLAALSFVQSPAHAVLTDLPNPDDFDSGGGAQQQAPAAPVEKIPVQTQYTGTVNVEGVSRKSGGTSYKIELKQALSLSRIDVRIVKSQLKVLQMILMTDSGQKIDVRQFKNTEVLATDSLTSSETLSQGERISSIEILAESFGGEADILLTAVADREVPKLTLKTQETPPALPARPTPSAPRGDSERPGRYEPPTNRRAADNKRALREGDLVMVMDREYAKAVVVGFNNNGTHIIRFLSGALSGKMGDRWERSSLSLMSGCTQDYCVGDVVYNKAKGEAQVRVVAVQHSGNVIIEFLDGALAGRLGGLWNSNDLTSVQKCGKSFCVGQRAYLYADGRDSSLVEVIAVDSAGKYTVYFHEGPVAGRRGSLWTDNNLARTEGCGANFCVGEIATNISRNFLKVQIVGLQHDGRYVLKFLEGNIAGRFGHSWSDSDLRKFRY